MRTNLVLARRVRRVIHRTIRRVAARGNALRELRLLGVLALCAGLPACTSYPVPLSAQAGSTIVIPLLGVPTPNTVIGYGGFSHTDYQRGAMIYRLDGPGGFELRTRFTIAAQPHFASEKAGVARSQQSYPFGSPPEILSIVDIPPDAPEGTHSLYVVRRLQDGTEIPGPDYDPPIKVLPNSIDVNGGAETVVGEYTPTALGNCTLYCGFAVGTGIPRPQIRIAISGEGTPIGAFEMELNYPAAVIDVVDAAEDLVFDKATNDAPALWIDDDGAGTARISGVAHPDGLALAKWTLHVVFVLDDGIAQILDPADVEVVSFTAYDLNGELVPAATTQIAGVL